MRVVCVLLCLGWLVAGVEVARAAPVKVCVSVRIQTYRPRAPQRKAAPKKSVKPTPKPAPKPALKPAPRPAPRPGLQPMAPPAAQPGTSGRPRKAPVWNNPFGRRKKLVRRVGSNRWRSRRRWRLPRQRRSPYPYPPQAYLRRLVEHYVTHAKGFLAVSKGCSARISIEMYPIRGGWTVFARYSRRANEEKVDRLEFGELTRFAERVVAALLHGRDISATANLRTILKADSLRQYRTIKGSHHFAFSLGAAPKVAYLPTYNGNRDSQGNLIGLERQFRLLTPLTFAMGYRGRFNAWGIDAHVRGGVGLQRESRLRNTLGGHVDLDGLFGVGLHFLRYHRPHGMISFYYGAGALFDLSFFSAIAYQTGHERTRFTAGGLNLNAIIGFEFMRASAAQFFIQLVLSAPVYVVEVAPEAGPNSLRVKTYIPELAATVGIMF